jgi:hypothetical protein
MAHHHENVDHQHPAQGSYFLLMPFLYRYSGIIRLIPAHYFRTGNSGS